MKRLLYIILYIALAVHASTQRLWVGEQNSGMVRVTGRVIDLQNRQSSESHTSCLYMAES